MYVKKRLELQLIGNGVGVDAEEDVLEGIEIAVETLEFGESGHEGVFFFTGVLVGEPPLTIEQIVGDVVIGPEFIGAEDTLVDELGDAFVVLVVGAVIKLHQIALRDELTNLEMDTTLGLENARQDAVEILARLLDVLDILTGIELQRLQDIARLPFIGHSDGGYVQLAQSGNLILGLAHAEHLDDALIRLVIAVLRPAVALGYPDGFALFLDDVADIAGEVEGALVEVLDAASWALYTEHPVGLADIDHQRIHHQIGTKGDLSGFQACIDQGILQQGGVEHDVTVIADKQIGRAFLQLLGTVERERRDAVMNDLLIHLVHDAILELLDGLETA